MAGMGQADYLLGHLSLLSGCECCWGAQLILHKFQAGTDVERAFSGDFDTTLVKAPLGYSYSPNREWALTMAEPIHYTVPLELD